MKQLDGILWNVGGLKIRFEKEHKFHDERRWRFDYVVSGKKIAVEIDGGVWSNKGAGGRHNRGTGFIKDMEKYNAAAKLGYRILRYPKLDVGQILGDVEEMLKLDKLL